MSRSLRLGFAGRLLIRERAAASADCSKIILKTALAVAVTPTLGSARFVEES
jgi:hypothetical protein